MHSLIMQGLHSRCSLCMSSDNILSKYQVFLIASVTRPLVKSSGLQILAYMMVVGDRFQPVDCETTTIYYLLLLSTFSLYSKSRRLNTLKHKIKYHLVYRQLTNDFEIIYIANKILDSKQCTNYRKGHNSSLRYYPERVIPIFYNNVHCAGTKFCFMNFRQPKIRSNRRDDSVQIIIVRTLRTLTLIPL